MTSSPRVLFRIVGLLLALTIFASACGGDDGTLASSDAVDRASESTGDTSTERSVTTSDGDAADDAVGPHAGDAMDDEAMDDDAMDEEAMDEEAMDEEAMDDGDVADSGGLDADSRSEVVTEADSPAAAAAPEPEDARPDPADVEEFTSDSADAEAAFDDSEPAADVIGPEPTPAPQPPAQAGLLTAGDVDDNLNQTFFTAWINRVQQSQGSLVPAVNLAGRVEAAVMTENGAGLGNVKLVVEDAIGNEATVVTSSAGTAWIYPFHLGLDPSDGLAMAVVGPDGQVNGAEDISTEQANEGPVTITVDAEARLPEGLDIALVLDATGSMADELSYLTVELESIIRSVERDYGSTDIRVALIVYRDEGDDYVTRVFDFAEVDEIAELIAEQRADGGGDFPEAMHTALQDAHSELSWRDGNVARMLVLNADAPPHARQLAATVDAGRALAADGVRIYPLAASGVDETAEFTMRVMAATSGGRHLFLTDDSGIGNAHSEPKVECYEVTPLRDLLIRVIATELAGERIEANDAQIVRTVGSVQSGICGS